MGNKFDKGLHLDLRHYRIRPTPYWYQPDTICTVHPHTKFDKVYSLTQLTHKTQLMPVGRLHQTDRDLGL